MLLATLHATSTARAIFANHRAWDDCLLCLLGADAEEPEEHPREEAGAAPSQNNPFQLSNVALERERRGMTNMSESEIACTSARMHIKLRVDGVCEKTTTSRSRSHHHHHHQPSASQPASSFGRQLARRGVIAVDSFDCSSFWCSSVRPRSSSERRRAWKIACVTRFCSLPVVCASKLRV